MPTSTLGKGFGNDGNGDGSGGHGSGGSDNSASGGGSNGGANAALGVFMTSMDLVVPKMWPRSRGSGSRNASRSLPGSTLESGS